MRRFPVMLAAAAALAAASPASALAAPKLSDGDGVHVASVTQIDPRLVSATLTTPLLTAPTNVRILLPSGYDAQPRERYPVLYLYPPTGATAQDWVAQGGAEQATAGLKLIVVIADATVDGQGAGWMTDWVNGGKFGAPEWETWHVGHLIPWIDSQLRTIPSRDGRAVAGASQGGFGAMSYAARHPDLFQAAVSFSGADDIAANGAIVDPLVTPIVNATEVGLDGVPVNSIFGDRATDEINWAAHDPATLAGNLRPLHLYAYTGNGLPGPYDTSGYDPESAVVETGAHELNELFHQELDKRGIPIRYVDYGAGTHSWPYWKRDLQDVIGALTGDFATPPAAPAKIDYESDAASYEQWGWSVAIARPARELSTLGGADARGFTLAGSGTATVTTPAVYRPGAAATVTRAGTAVHDTLTQRVDGSGRLRLAVPLGPGNPAQEDTAGATTHVYTTTVGISAPPARCATARTVTLRPRLPRGARIERVRAHSGTHRLHAVRRGRRVAVRLAGLSGGKHRIALALRIRVHGHTRSLRIHRVVRAC